MINLFLDIETLPGEESLRDEIARTIAPPAQMKRVETIEKWKLEEKSTAVEKTFRDSSFRRAVGRILCIGYVKEAPGDVTKDVLAGDEASILRAFWELTEDVDLFVGHNIFDFDLKFIMQHSIINGVKPTREISFTRYRNHPVYDTKAEWACWSQDRIKLSELTQALGIPSPKDEMDGSQVYDYYSSGREREIFEYCLKDVEATRVVYKKMTFVE